VGTRLLGSLLCHTGLGSAILFSRLWAVENGPLTMDNALAFARRVCVALGAAQAVISRVPASHLALASARPVEHQVHAARVAGDDHHGLALPRGHMRVRWERRLDVLHAPLRQRAVAVRAQNLLRAPLHAKPCTRAFSTEWVACCWRGRAHTRQLTDTAAPRGRAPTHECSEHVPDTVLYPAHPQHPPPTGRSGASATTRVTERPVRLPATGAALRHGSEAHHLVVGDALHARGVGVALNLAPVLRHVRGDPRVS
jgi:hypothetical protein